MSVCEGGREHTRHTGVDDLLDANGMSLGLLNLALEAADGICAVNLDLESNVRLCECWEWVKQRTWKTFCWVVFTVIFMMEEKLFMKE